MYSKLGTVVALVLAAFPFLALGYTMADDSTIGISIYAVIVVILLAGLLLGPRVSLAALDVEPSKRPAHEPAPPIEWNWDGVNRQPGEE